MNDDEIKDDELEGDLDPELDDDLLVPGSKKSKKIPDDEDSLDELADEEDVVLPEDKYDDEDLW